ncbi:stress responsive alpha/beta barrel protein [Prosthecobacter fusiformis]|uniref:Stress responsive alpha/beta barrel protein n=1 Tax=Prosthecobacter fusiformis TaxID=48464 RepID=A0A4R7SS83_9BACT|nr:Dabb family protein [Prosthecobacter fusiformis]TDU81595.1 stress responsive alpha/beta barrel protein [Prosthecobacter fusiformis]
MQKAIAFFTFAALSLLASCTSCPLGHKTTAQGKVEHVVLIWLKKPGDAKDRAAVVAAAKKFQAEIPQIQHLSVGQPLPSDRPVVDDSFDVGMVIRFANQADLSVYEKHPVHTQAVTDTLKPLAKKLLVYDVVTE